MDQNIPAVSIVIPVFNVEKYIGKCLDSLISQTLHNIEIICVNDCSTDKSLDILRDYEAKDNRIVVIDLPRNIKQGLLSLVLLIAMIGFLLTCMKISIH